MARVVFIAGRVWFFASFRRVVPRAGAVLHFVGFLPCRRRAACRQRSDRCIGTRIDPSAALALVPEASDLRLISVGGRPVYVAKVPSGAWVAVAADTGD